MNDTNLLKRYNAVVRIKTAKGYDDVFSASSDVLESVQQSSTKANVLNLFYELDQMDLSGAKVIITDRATNEVLSEKDWV